ncbi:hypothetical protein BaRGS_00010982 [Batillaria attramentaria]|uniref:Uncharacterized protein n=1 Tax=Batillaria attramentaria TaxID=370345 RepID=A0ABD0LF21_9CAEN
MDREKGVGGGGRGGGRRKRRVCGGSRLWIFLIVGALLEVLGLIVGGIYLNVRSLTASLQHTEILPTYIPVAAGQLRPASPPNDHLNVFVTSVVSVGVGLLCGGTAVLMGTHIIRPMLHFVTCSMYQPGNECHCLSPYNRQQLSVQYSEKALTTYVYINVTSCGIIQSDLLQMLYAMCGVYTVIFITSVMVTVLALLAYRTERIRKRHLEDESYEEIFTVSNSSTPRSTHNDTEQQGMIQQTAQSSTTDRENHSSDFIYSPSDIPVDYNEACRMRRSHSFSQPRRPNQSFDSTESNTAYNSSTLGRGEGRRQGEGQGRLKEHRRRTRRAVTLANLDTQQLMLILSLQMRYLQETEAEKQQAGQVNPQRKLDPHRRRAITPTPRQERASSAGNYSDVDTRPVKMVRSHTPQPYQTYNHSAAQSLQPPAVYENAGAHALVSPIDYENVDSCVAAASRGAASSLGASLGPSSSSAQRTLTPAERDIASPKTASIRRAEARNGRAIAADFLAQGRTKVPARASSYENVDDMSSSGESALLSSTHSDPVYENQGSGQRDPLYENQATASMTALMHNSRKRRTKHKSSNPALLSGRTEIEHPARPKSYINAVEGVESSVPCDDSTFSEYQAGIDSKAVTSNPDQRSHLPQSPMQSYSPHLMASVPTFGSVTLTCDAPASSRDDSRLDIYALPKKKGRPLPVAPPMRNAGYTIPGSEAHKSAFHKVSRQPQSPSYSAPCDTDLDDLDPAPRQKSRKKTKPLPPYSPPPSYECLSASRQSSLCSLTSSSSRATDDVDNELYKQIKKKKGAGMKPRMGQSPRGSNQCLYSGQGHQGNHVSSRPTGNQGYPGFQGHSYQGLGGYYHGDHPGIHSFPFRKHHPPVSPQESHYVHMGPPTRPTLAKSYEDLDDVFELPSGHGQRSGHRGDGMQFDINSNRMPYEGIMRLASGTEDDSDSEYMETVI